MSRPRATLALALQLGALGVLSLALLEFAWLDARSLPRVLVLVDRSLSMPRQATDTALAQVMRAVKDAGGSHPLVLEFAGETRAAASAQLTPQGTELKPSTTHIERALDAALAAHARVGYSAAVIISDGHENAGDAARALRSVREAQLPVYWIAMGRAPPKTHIVDVLSPRHATADQVVELTVQLNQPSSKSLRVTAAIRDAKGGTHAVSGEPDSAGRATLKFAARGDGPLLVDVALEDPASGERLDARPNAAVIDVTARAAILYVQGSPGSLARSLLEGGWMLNVVPSTRIDAYTDRLGGYKAVVLDDVAIADAGAQFWNALVTAVRDRGVGLMVLGGERSFMRGGYSQSPLESVLPVLSEPAALDQPASVVFVVDKSGSMGEGSGGVDRFRLAQRAVLETARGLSERDSLGLVVFDVEPRVLIPLAPTRAGTHALAKDWQASPRGGTQLAPAIAAGIAELERAGAGRRLLVVVTDGYIDSAPLMALRARLDRSRIETIALAVGPDADVSALQGFIGSDAGVVLRVNATAELPRVMRSSVEQRRARIERGKITVKQQHPMPFAPVTLKDWPGISAYAVTRSRPQASVPLQSERGDPLLAVQTAGLGRVVTVTSGLGTWTPQWLQWTQWPQLAGGLTEWISRTTNDGTLALSVSDLPDRLHIDVDVRSSNGWSAPEQMSIVMTAPAGEARVVPSAYVAPGRLRMSLPDEGPGVYMFIASSSLGTQKVLHLRRNRAEDEAWGTSPALEAWKSAGLINNWDPAILQRPTGTRVERQIDRWLIGLALVLFLAGVIVDRLKLMRKL